MNNGNKGLLYASSGIYLISALCAGDPDWQLFQIAPFVFAVLVLVGTLIAKEEKRWYGVKSYLFPEIFETIKGAIPILVQLFSL